MSVSLQSDSKMPISVVPYHHTLSQTVSHELPLIQA